MPCFGKPFSFVCVAALVLVGCAKKDPPAFERPPAPVTVASAISLDVPYYLDEVGRCVAREVVLSNPRYPGVSRKSILPTAADLKKDDPLFTIDPRPFKAQLDAAEANLAQSRAALDFARIQFAASRTSWSQRPLPGRTTTPGKTPSTWRSPGQAESSRRRVRALESGVHVDPFAHRWARGHRLVDVGNVVTANNSTLLNIERLDPSTPISRHRK